MFLVEGCINEQMLAVFRGDDLGRWLVVQGNVVMLAMFNTIFEMFKHA